MNVPKVADNAVAGPFFISALSVANIINAVLATVWVLFVGYRLYRLGQRDSRM